LAAADRSIEEDSDRNMVVTITIRAATAIVIRIMAAPLFGRDCVWRVTASVELIGWYPVADMRTQIERAALRRYFSLRENGCDCSGATKQRAKTSFNFPSAIGDALQKPEYEAVVARARSHLVGGPHCGRGRSPN
jgi:hypothetical protein